MAGKFSISSIRVGKGVSDNFEIRNKRFVIRDLICYLCRRFLLLEGNIILIGT